MFLYSNYNTKIRLESIGHMVNLNPRYLCTVFRQVTGRTINQYLTEIRIEKAKRLLLYTSLSITEIALETGFSSSQYFSNVFRRAEGIEPSIYRKTRTRGVSDIYI
jgi:AraC-like DNA-binding protein